jgi:hypothetical protein
MASSRLRTAMALSITLALFLGVPVDTAARGASRSSAYSPRSAASGGSHRSTLSSSRRSIKCESHPRDNRGKIKRDPKATSEFKRTQPMPSGCDRCEIDHSYP